MGRYAVLLFCLAAAGCRSAPPGPAQIDPALATLIPSNAVTLVGIRMEPLRATPVYQKWVAARPIPFADQLAKDTGIDPRKDLWELLIASDGADTVMLARGKFSATGEEPRINRPNLKRTPYKGYTLVGNDDGAVVFVNSTTAIAGRPAAVRTIIDERDRPRSANPAALLEKAKSIPAGNQIWAVSIGGFGQIQKAAPQTGNMANIGKILSMIQNFTAAADLRQGVNAFATALCKTEQDAVSLSDALRGLIGLARLSTPDNEPDMLRVYDGVQVEKDRQTVRVRAQVPQNLTDKLIEKALNQPRMNQPRMNLPWPPATQDNENELDPE